MADYTTKELAQKLNVTKQTIRNATKRLELEVSKNGTGAYVYTQEQAEKIANKLGKSWDAAEAHHQKNDDSYDVLVNVLMKQVEDLREQVKLKDEQIRNRDEQITSLLETAKALSASNAVQVAADNKALLVVDNNQESEKKKGFWSRLFGWRQ